MRLFAAGLAMLAALVLAACGGSGSATSTPAADTHAVPTTAGSGGVSPGQASAATGTATGTAASTTTTGTTTGGSDGGAAASGPAASGPAASGPAASSAAGCRAAGLAVSFLGGQGATGHGELGFALRNTGSGPCSTGGYPGVQFLAAGGAALPTAPSHATTDFFGSSPERALVIAPGQSVSFRLDVSHGSGSGAGCHTASALQVIAPNDTATLTATVPGGALECGAAVVSPVQPGESAYR
jgi:hypothetical protein